MMKQALLLLFLAPVTAMANLAMLTPVSTLALKDNCIINIVNNKPSSFFIELTGEGLYQQHHLSKNSKHQFTNLNCGGTYQVFATTKHQDNQLYCTFQGITPILLSRREVTLFTSKLDLSKQTASCTLSK